ncbi:creatininase family protein, partial [Micromonospora sp. NPDC002296]|uniref:creatininase family protein n=1 Tax=Micromonospora sp. NPDC002296 TaxID=3154271 RepID=UPI003319AA0E
MTDVSPGGDHVAAWLAHGGLVLVARVPGGELAAVAGAADFAVLPVGAVEWHGPHLPLGTDLILAEGFAAESATSSAAGPGGTQATPSGGDHPVAPAGVDAGPGRGGGPRPAGTPARGPAAGGWAVEPDE